MKANCTSGATQSCTVRWQPVKKERVVSNDIDECNTSLITSSETSLHVTISADKSCCFPSNTYHLNEAEWFNYTPLLPSWPQGTFFTCSLLSPDPESWENILKCPPKAAGSSLPHRMDPLQSQPWLHRAVPQLEQTLWRKEGRCKSREKVGEEGKERVEGRWWGEEANQPTCLTRFGLIIWGLHACTHKINKTKD